mmetsp:Transcript_11253/g.48030  ORF Transcript_11253/g.48030 Transcript_11253/m.48030 type:complete len:253 (+) Transcript_11253:645-1403(+)
MSGQASRSARCVCTTPNTSRRWRSTSTTARSPPAMPPGAFCCGTGSRTPCRRGRARRRRPSPSRTPTRTRTKTRTAPPRAARTATRCLARRSTGTRSASGVCSSRATAHISSPGGKRRCWCCGSWRPGRSPTSRGWAQRSRTCVVSRRTTRASPPRTATTRFASCRWPAWSWRAWRAAFGPRRSSAKTLRFSKRRPARSSRGTRSRRNPRPSSESTRDRSWWRWRRAARRCSSSTPRTTRTSRTSRSRRATW